MAGNGFFELEFEVRDYECDLQGIVNNAVYLNYLEHARHRYLKSIGLDFAALHERGCDLVVTRSEIDYESPLRSGDRFLVRSRVRLQRRVRFQFEQEIVKLPGQERVLQAVISGTGVIDGRIGLPPELFKQTELPRGGPSPSGSCPRADGE